MRRLSVLLFVSIVHGQSLNINPLGFFPNSSVMTSCDAKQIPCGVTDLTPANWVANDIDNIVSCKLQTFINANSPFSNVPQAYLNSKANNILRDNGLFDCTDVTNADGCTFPGANTDGAAGTNCDFFADNGGIPQDGLIFSAFSAAFNTLNAWHTAVQQAHDELVSESWIDTMVAAVGREKLPIPRSVLFKLVSLSLSFIPSPVGILAGAELAAAKGAIKAFKKVAKETIDGGKGDVQSQEDTDNAQPTVLKSFLDDIVPTFQQSIKEQHAAIFIDPVPAFDLSISNLLSGGAVLATQSQDGYTQAVKRNMKAYLMAQMMANTDMILLLDSNLGSCDSGDLNDGTQCRRFGYLQPNVPPSAATIDRPGNILAVNGFGFSLAEIADNAVSCARNGGNFESVDFDEFLESDSSSSFPNCLFGIGVIGALP